MPSARNRKKASSTTSSQRLIGGILVEITKRRRQKNLYVRVHPPEGKVTVSAPSHFPDESINSFVLQKLPMIKAAQQRIRSEFRMRTVSLSQEKRIICGANLTHLKS